MKSVNDREIKGAYKRFLWLFILLLFFSLNSVFLYLKASEEEYFLLKKEYDKVENLISSRNEVNKSFGEINRLFKEIGQGNNDMSAFARKKVIQNEINKKSGDISRIIKSLEADTSRNSLKLYSRLNRDVMLISKLQDSLFSTKNVIESKRLQLESCIQTNRRINQVVGQGSMVNR